MRWFHGERWNELLRGERGQVLPLVALMMMVLLGLAGLAIDGGRAMYSSRVLQASGDSAALAGAQALPTATSTSVVTAAMTKYSAASGGLNISPVFLSVTETGTLKCFTAIVNQGEPCVGTVPYNGVQVVQTAVMKMYFASLFGHPTMTIQSVSTAARASSKPANVAVIVDTTLSMNGYDSNCGSTQETCALQGVQILLQHLSPCVLPTQSNCTGVNSFDRVSLFTFPNVSVSTASTDVCTTLPWPTPDDNTKDKGYNGYISGGSTYGIYSMQPGAAYSGVPVALPYSTPIIGSTYLGITGPSTAPTYQITPYLSDYRVSNVASALNATSALVKASGAVSGCGGMAAPNYEGDYETYYAGVLYAAQSTLVAQQALYPGSQNVIIILSDGDANAQQSCGTVLPSCGYLNLGAAKPSGNYTTPTSSGTYPSWVNDCKQSVTAAQAAATSGTLVYAVAYGSPTSGGCGTDQVATTPCKTMAGMASSPTYFYSDYSLGGADSGCYSAQSVSSLSGIFSAIAGDFTTARLIPNSTT